MSVEAFTKALVAFQAEIPSIGKDQTANTGQFSYSYADLTKIHSVAMPVLTKHGLAWIAKPTMTEHGFVLAYSLLHVEGHREDGEYPLPDPSRSTPQQIGSALTYGRRYSFCAATGLAPGGEDDDGAAASRTRTVGRPDPLKAAKDRVWAAAQHLGWDGETLATDYMRENDAQISDATASQLTAYAVRLEVSTPDVAGAA